MKKIETSVPSAEAMDNEAKAQFINDNIGAVPPRKRNYFNTLDLDGQVRTLQNYLVQQAIRREYAEKNKLENKIATLFEQRNGTVEQAKAIMIYLQNFIDSAKEREITKIDEEIAKLQLMKQSLED